MRSGRLWWGVGRRDVRGVHVGRWVWGKSGGFWQFELSECFAGVWEDCVHPANTLLLSGVCVCVCGGGGMCL